MIDIGEKATSPDDFEAKLQETVEGFYRLLVLGFREFWEFWEFWEFREFREFREFWEFWEFRGFRV